MLLLGSGSLQLSPSPRQIRRGPISRSASVHETLDAWF